MESDENNRIGKGVQDRGKAPGSFHNRNGNNIDELYPECYWLTISYQGLNRESSGLDEIL